MQGTWSGDQQQQGFTGVVGNNREAQPVNFANAFSNFLREGPSVNKLDFKAVSIATRGASFAAVIAFGAEACPVVSPVGRAGD